MDSREVRLPRAMIGALAGTRAMQLVAEVERQRATEQRLAREIDRVQELVDGPPGAVERLVDELRKAGWSAERASQLVVAMGRAFAKTAATAEQLDTSLRGLRARQRRPAPQPWPPQGVPRPHSNR